MPLTLENITLCSNKITSVPYKSTVPSALLSKNCEAAFCHTPTEHFPEEFTVVEEQLFCDHKSSQLESSFCIASSFVAMEN